MAKFTVHTIDTAPEKSKLLLESIQKQFGFIPNLMGILAEAPNVLKSYLELSANFSTGTLTPIEVQVVALSVSYENKCAYCMAAHSAMANMSKMDPQIVESLRQGDELSDPKLNGLSKFTKIIIKERGYVPEPAMADLFSIGYTKAAVLEVILGVSMKTLSNYVNHLAHTPLDKAFEPMKWE